jgi:aspartyl-tRNA(Asn)/glutamyl-tRNA(Gln) amidotransferase subunit A
MPARADDPCSLSACETVARVRDARLRAVEVTQSYLERAERLDHTVHAYITLRRDRAVSEAARIDDEIEGGRSRGPLHGLAIGVKDNIHTAGDLTTAASRILADNITASDATAVARLKRDDAVVLGKQTLMEFAMGDDVNPLTGRGPARNPWDLTRSASGSSSGSAAAVAASMCSAALGTDTGGSVRLPAAFCGLVGMKPTFGRVSRHGVIPLAWSMDCAGPITRTVADNALILQRIAGHDGHDPTCARRPLGNYLAALGARTVGVRVGLPRRFFIEYAMPETVAAIESVARRLEELGAQLVEVDLPHLKFAVGAWTTIALVEMAAYHAVYVNHGRLPEYTEMNRLNLTLANSVTAADYVQAQRVRQSLMRDFQRSFAKVDMILSPTAPDEANLIEEDLVASELPKRSPRAGTTTLMEMTLRMTAPASLVGVPALAFPCGYSTSGLPLSAQLMGRWFQEELLYRVAFSYEQATEWHTRRAPLCSA